MWVGGLRSLVASHLANHVSRRRLTRRFPRLAEALDELARQSRSPHKDVWSKVGDLVAHLDAARPREIVELGAGRSTLAISFWAAETGALFQSLDQSVEWRDAANTVLQDTLGIRPVVHSPLRLTPSGGHYADQPPPTTDFFYVDGPHVPIRARLPTYTGGPVCADLPMALARGLRPAVILIDGRTDTVDAIRGCAIGYRMQASYAWAKERRHADVRHARRHTQFAKISGAA
jgi:hypothetical protein